jgi:hypothetical protein
LIKKICFDIDGIICNTKKSNYKKSTPIIKNIKIINKLYKNKFIILYTARCMGRTNDNSKRAEKLIKALTILQLKKWGVKYNKILFGKPSYDLVIDDKSLFFNKNWSKLLIKKFNI